jgi:hypothetical protein
MIFTPLSKEDRKLGRESFNELLNAPDDDPHAILTVLAVTSLIVNRKKAREEEKRSREGGHEVRRV